MKPAGRQHDRWSGAVPFMFATGVENSAPTIQGGRVRVDELEKCGDYEHWQQDLDLVVWLGLTFLRYGPPLHRTFLDRGRWPMVGFTWYSLIDQVDWDTALREPNGRVNPLGLFDLKRQPRRVAHAYAELISAWREVLPTQTVCLQVPVRMPANPAGITPRRELGPNQPPIEPSNADKDET